MEDLEDIYDAAVNDGNVEQMQDLYYNATACIMPPNSEVAGWCPGGKLNFHYVHVCK